MRKGTATSEKLPRPTHSPRGAQGDLWLFVAWRRHVPTLFPALGKRWDRAAQRPVNGREQGNAVQMGQATGAQAAGRGRHSPTPPRRGQGQATEPHRGWARRSCPPPVSELKRGGRGGRAALPRSEILPSPRPPLERWLACLCRPPRRFGSPRHHTTPCLFRARAPSPCAAAAGSDLPANSHRRRFRPRTTEPHTRTHPRRRTSHPDVDFTLPRPLPRVTWDWEQSSPSQPCTAPGFLRGKASLRQSFP